MYCSKELKKKKVKEKITDNWEHSVMLFYTSGTISFNRQDFGQSHTVVKYGVEIGTHVSLILKLVLNH